MKIGDNLTIARSQTGVYHVGLGPTATACRQGLKNRPARDQEIKAAPASAFCERCFPKGKPE